MWGTGGMGTGVEACIESVYMSPHPHCPNTVHSGWGTLRAFASKINKDLNSAKIQSVIENMNNTEALFAGIKVPLELIFFNKNTWV